MCVDAYESGFSKTLLDLDREIEQMTGAVKAKFPGGQASEAAEAYEEHLRRFIIETFDRRAEELRTIRSILKPRG